MNNLWQDVRYAVRMLMKSPGFTLIAVCALALGIGANTAIFSVVNAVLLKALPFEQPDRIARFYNPTTGEPASMSYPDFQDFASRAQTLQHVAAYLTTGTTLATGGEPERVRGASVSASLFPLLGASAAVGRVFNADEDRDGAPEVIVISHEFWQRRFGGAPDIIGQQIPLGTGGKTVVGVMPPSFRFPVASAHPQEFWMPLLSHPSVKRDAARRGAVFLDVVAKLKPSVTTEKSNAELDTIARALEAQYPDTNTGRRVSLVSLHESLTGNIKPALYVLLGAVALVLLIACANVANLLLARAAARGKEIAVRTALGASRGRVVRQLLTESLLLSLVGGALGLLLAVWGVDLLVAIAPAGVPRLKDVSLDASVLAFTFMISTLTGVLFGLVPALQASKLDLNESLKEGGRGSTEGGNRSRVRSALVISEVALTLVLLISAGLLIKSFWSLLNTDPGYATDRVLTMTVPLSSAKYPQPEDRAAVFQQILRRTGELPGVVAVGATGQLPLGGNENIFDFEIEGRPPSAPGARQQAGDLTVTPGYFRALNIPVMKGRDFTETDKSDSPPVAIVNETFARRYFPGEDPVGKRIFQLSESQPPPPPLEIVGVVGDVRHQDLGSVPYADVYFPHAQDQRATMDLVVRTASLDANEVAPAVRGVIHEINREQLIWQTRTINELVAGSVAPRRFNMILLGTFAVVALMLAAVGIFGVINYAVTQRTHEIGIRLALGARGVDVLKMIVKQGMWLALLGIVIGLAAAFALTRVLTSLLYGVSATDPLTFGSIAALLAAVALIACYIPARRATKVDPMVALRYE